MAPILFANCSPCHRPEGPAPFSLLSYEDARKRARQIATVTRTRYMPPWLPEPGFGDFAGARGLNEAEQATLERWAAGGVPRGDPSDLPAAPEFPHGWQLGEPDLVLEMAETYTLPAGGPDVYRNFVIPVSARERRWVRAVELKPGNPKVVHHARLEVDETWHSRFEDGRDREPGYDGMISAGGRNPDGFFVGWTPGKIPWRGWPDMAWRLEPGVDLVLQLHLLPSGKPEPIHARVGLFFADGPPERQPLVVRLGPNTIDIPPGEKAYVLRDRWQLPVDVEVLAVYPHAHYVAASMKAWATLPSGERAWLLRIDAWDFDWQDDYRYARPVPLPKGAWLEMEYVYDNSSDNVRNPSRPPQRVTYGPNSSDEMGDLILQVLPRAAEDRALLRREFAARERVAVEAGLRAMLRGGRHGVLAHCLLGNELLAQDRFDEAIEHYREALDAEPNHVPARYGLATALLRWQRPEAALGEYRRALRLAPDLVEARYGLGMALQAQRRFDEAIRAYRQALELVPRHARAHYGMGVALRARGRHDEAIAHLEQAVAANPELAPAQAELASALHAAGRAEQAIRHYREALRLRPDSTREALGLARALETAGQRAEALERLEDLVRREPGLPEAHYELGVVLKRAGRLDEALDHLHAAVRLKPDYVEALNDLATGLARRGRLEEAAQWLRRAVEVRPGFADSHFNLGVVLQMQGKASEAARHFDEALRLKPELRRMIERGGPS